MKHVPQLLLAATFLTAPLARAAGSSPGTADEAEPGFSHYALSNGYGNWDSLYLDAVHRFGERSTRCFASCRRHSTAAGISRPVCGTAATPALQQT